MHTHASVTRRQQVFGYTEEELRILLTPMANTGAEPIGSMGTDTPIAALSDKPRLLFDYFAQLFAQVTNPPLDAIREELVTSLSGTHRARGQPARADARPPAARWCCRSRCSPTTTWPRSATSTTTATCPGFETHVARGPVRRRGRRRGDGARASTRSAPRSARRSPAVRASSCSPTGTPPRSWRRSRRCCSPAPSTTTWSARRRAPRSACSSRPATSARSTTSPCSWGTARQRSTRTSPWSPSRTSPARGSSSSVEPEQAVKNLIKALGKGVLKVMSKMGVSTVASYTGAQIFEAVGLSQALVDRYFTGTTSKLGGVELDTIAEEVAPPARDGVPARRHRPVAPRARDRRGVPVAARGRAAPVRPRDRLPAPALHPYRPLRHLQAVHPARRRAVRAADDAARACSGSGTPTRRAAQPIPLDEVEPVSAIVKRFSTGAMSYGSISKEAHETLAIAMNSARREVQHRRGRRGRGPAVRRRAAQRDQAGRVRSLRRDRGVPHQLRRHPDQDGPGRQAGRGWPAARPQGLPVGGQDAVLDARRRA